MRKLATTIPCLLLGLMMAAGPSAELSAQRRKIDAGPWTTKRKIPEGWIVHRTKYYEVQSQCGIDKAKRLGKHMEVMNKVYRKMFRPDKDGAKRQVIKLFKDREAYLRYDSPPGSAAYYSRGEREMVCYDTGKWGDDKKLNPITGKDAKAATQRRLARLGELMKMDLLGCAAHEGWHQYFSWYVGSMVVLPSWINEGIGDYFYTAAPKDVRGRKMPAKLGRINDGRLMVLKAAIRQGRFVPVQELITMSKMQFYSNPGVCYAEGWAFCQFLLHSGNKKYAKIIPNFVRYVRNNTNFEQVRKRAFKRIDMVKLEAEFKAWVEQLPMPGEEKAGV